MNDLLSVEEAQELILHSVQTFSETVEMSLLQAVGRALAEDIVSPVHVPPFDNAAVDGYAVVAKDTESATVNSPARLRVVRTVHAGDVADFTIGRGEAARVMTGAPVPVGADAMVMIEDTEQRGSEVWIKSPARIGQHIRRRGEAVAQGNTVLQKGQSLGAGEILALAAIGRGSVPVIRPASVCLLTTGDELVEPGQPLPAGKIYNSNRYALSVQIGETGAVLDSLHVPDDPVATREALRQAQEHDMVLTAGGVSVGERDFVKQAVQSLGELRFWRVAVKPGKPIAFGRVGQALFVGLPGNPVSAMVTFELFVRPALRKMMGHRHLFRPQVQATLEHDLGAIGGRREYIRGRLRWSDGRWLARSTGSQASGMVASMIGANALIVAPARSELRQGDLVNVIMIDLPSGNG
ncbi:MAG: molybdopterin molybdotransferase MoeA [Armatimonadota bacterium]|nr:molybdopterin molybdotransferase MoeA [bacterium]MDW8320612.1 molybdopterin molybdotransferase MoeA [Armatimonadota bacterium]